MNRLTEVILGIKAVLGDEGIRTVTVFYSPKERVRITRGKRNSGIVVNIGRPNYLEREYLRDCKKDGIKPLKVWAHRFVR
jgi:hypothetical protein